MPKKDQNTRLDNLLIDTWWYGLSVRLDDERFEALACQRAAEGFNAVQLVAGIPPEVAPGHPQALSAVGLPWDMQGNINAEYLALARKRIKRLNDLGLRVIVLGGWGMQIEWTGARFMRRWWQALIETLDDLDVIYCVTGEVDLWIDMPNILMPDRSTDDLRGDAADAQRPFRRQMERVVKKLLRIKTRLFQPYAESKRRSAWGAVLKTIKKASEHPVIVHTGGQPGTHSHNQIDHPDLLAAITVQTGHDQSTRPLLWELPLSLRKEYPIRFINLEPWYEGIRDNFYTEDQLFAYWCNMLAGACSFAYGAHGVWNVGDGQFLAHWGRQSLEQAMALETTGLLGKSHAWFVQHMGYENDSVSEIKASEGNLYWIKRSGIKGNLTFIPDIAQIDEIGLGSYFDPMQGREVVTPPDKGPLIIWQAA